MTASAKRRKAYKKGLWAEYLAAAYYVLRGYRIVKIRYKTPLGEIDLVARRKNRLAIVEVKARRTPAEGLEAVGFRAQNRIERAARHFLATHPAYAECDVRFDVVSVSPPFGFTCLDNAWQARS